MIEKLHLEKKIELAEEPETGKKLSKEEQKKRSFWSSFFKKEKVKKPKMVACLYLRNNGIADPMYIESSKGMFIIDDKTYHEREYCRYLLGKDRVPFAVIPEDGLTPIPNIEYWREYDKEYQRKCQEHQDMAIKAIRHAEIVRAAGEDKKGLNPKLVVIFVIIAIIAFAFLKNYV